MAIFSHPPTQRQYALGVDSAFSSIPCSPARIRFLSEPRAPEARKSLLEDSPARSSHNQMERLDSIVYSCLIDRSRDMCFYEQIVFSCGDFKWSRFKQHCNKEYRTGETCGMKLVMDVQRASSKCVTCQRIEVKQRRRAKEEERIARWKCESNRSASITKSVEEIRALDQEIYALNLERQGRSSTLVRSGTDPDVKIASSCIESFDILRNRDPTRGSQSLTANPESFALPLTGNEKAYRLPERCEIDGRVSPANKNRHSIWDDESHSSGGQSVFSEESMSSRSTVGELVVTVTSRLVQCCSCGNADYSTSLSIMYAAMNLGRQVPLLKATVGSVGQSNFSHLDVLPQHNAQHQTMLERYLKQQISGEDVPGDPRRLESDGGWDSASGESNAERFVSTELLGDLDITQLFTALRGNLKSLLQPLGISAFNVIDTRVATGLLNAADGSDDSPVLKIGHAAAQSNCNSQLTGAGDVEKALGHADETVHPFDTRQYGDQDLNYEPSWFTLQRSRFRNYASGCAEIFKRRKVLDGFTRFRWSCKCGRIFTELVQELTPGATDNFAKSVGEDNFQSSSYELVQAPPPASNFVPCIFEPGSRCLQSHTPGDRPVLESDSDDNKTDITLAKEEYLLLCFPETSYKIRLLHDDIANKLTDQEVFASMAEAYNARWKKTLRWLTLRELKRIDFTSFQLYHTDKIAIHPADIDKIPTCGAPHPGGCGNSCIDGYTYTLPATDMFPPVPSQALMHFFAHPTHCGASGAIRMRLPKKTQGRVQLCEGETFKRGWGLRFREGIDWFKLLAVMSGFLVVSLGFGILWCARRGGSLQDGFAVAGWVLGVATIVVGFAHLASDSVVEE